MGFVRRGGAPVRALILGFFLILPAVTQAADPAVEVEVGAEKRSFTRGELLARPDAVTIEVPKEVTSGAPMTYRAVPAAALLSGLTFPPGSVIEAVAIDGFAAQIPLDLMLNTDPSKSMAWVAIEPADQPLAQGARQGLHRRAVLRRVDQARGVGHPQRVLGLSTREA